jgi:hypothetical protein
VANLVHHNVTLFCQCFFFSKLVFVPKKWPNPAVKPLPISFSFPPDTDGKNLSQTLAHVLKTHAPHVLWGGVYCSFLVWNIRKNCVYFFFYFILICYFRYSNIFVTSPSPENLGTVFQLLISGLKVLALKNIQNIPLSNCQTQI